MFNILPRRRGGRKLAVRNEPVNSISAMQDEINHMFDRFFDDSFGLSPLRNMMGREGNYFPMIDVSESEKDVKVTVDIPGVDENDINVSLSHNVLDIHGEKKFEKEDKEENYHYVERSYGSFRRSVTLPCEVDDENIDAVYKNGVLTITLPKSEAEQRKRISIKSK